MGKDYGQYCGLARALDVVGDRWNLLIVRQLLIGPARYGELRDGLTGVATNLLAARLRDLEAAGVLERRLGDDGAVEYALTPWGRELREPIEGLIRWSSPLMIRGAQGDRFRTEWLLVALPALFAQRSPSGQPATIGIVVDGQTVVVHADASGWHVGVPDDRKLDAVISAEAPIVLGLAAGMLTLDAVAESVDITGDTAAVRAVFGR